MLEQIKAKALELQPKVIAAAREHGPKAIVMAPLILVPAFVALVATAPGEKAPAPTVSTQLGVPGNVVVIKLPPATPYKPGNETVVQSQQVVQVETKVVYVEVPAKDGKPATVEKKVVQVPVVVTAPPPAPVPEPVKEEPKKTELDRIMTEPPPPAVIKQAPRTVQMTPVQYASMKNFQPPYPEDLRAAGVQGIVKVRVVVGPDGRPRLIRPLMASNPRFFRAVQAHGIKNWRFKPAMVDGMPSTGNIDVTLTFKMEKE